MHVLLVMGKRGGGPYNNLMLYGIVSAKRDLTHTS